MQFLGNVGDQAFRTAPDGRRLFYTYGPWSRPYVVPDAETERRLSDKQRWLLGAMLGLVVVGQEIVRIFGTDTISTAVGFLGYLAFVLLGYLVVQQVLYRDEFRHLVRADSRLSFHDYYADVAARRSVGYMLMQIGLSMGFIALGVWLVAGQGEPVIGWALIGLFTLFGAVWLYPLRLKLTHRAG